MKRRDFLKVAGVAPVLPVFASPSVQTVAINALPHGGNFRLTPCPGEPGEPGDSPFEWTLSLNGTDGPVLTVSRVEQSSWYLIRDVRRDVTHFRIPDENGEIFAGDAFFLVRLCETKNGVYLGCYAVSDHPLPAHMIEAAKTIDPSWWQIA